MFTNRVEAGQRLAEALIRFKDEACVIYAIPRGGIVLGAEIAGKLEKPLDLIITRKVGHPSNPEYAVCVVAEDGHEMCNQEEIGSIDKGWLAEAKEKERQEAKRRRLTYLGSKEPISAEGKTAIVVDDGIATGMTFLMAVKEVKHHNPAKIVAAVPVMPADFEDILRKEVDEIVCLDIDPYYEGAVGAYYGDFPQVTDEEVKKLMGEI